jgi:hypothetical protein
VPFSEWTQGPLPDRPLPGMLKAGLSGFYRELPYAARSMASGVDPACAPPTRLRGSAQRTESNTRVTPPGRRSDVRALMISRSCCATAARMWTVICVRIIDRHELHTGIQRRRARATSARFRSFRTAVSQ